MVEDLDHLLARHHLFNIAVQITQCPLLLVVVGLASLSAIADIEKHDHIAYRYYQGEPPVEDEEHGQGTCHLNEALDHHSEAVVQGVRNGVHVVGEVAHHVAVAAGIEEAEGQLLEMGEQVPADIVKYLLCRLHHGLGIAPGRQGSRQIDEGSDGHPSQQGFHPPCSQVIDHRSDHIGAQQVGQSTDSNQHRYRQQQELVSSQIGQKGANGVTQVLGLFCAELSSHSPPLLSSGMRRSPGRWGHAPIVPYGCRRREFCRPPG